LLGFTFNGQNSGNFGIVMRSKNRQLLPQTADNLEEIPGRDGSILFPGSLQDRLIEVDCSFVETSIPNLRKRARQMAAWLYTSTWADLIFDDEPDLKYSARVANQLDLVSTVSLGTFTLQFRCLPLALSVEQFGFFEVIGSGTFSIQNNGTRETLPVITISAIDLGDSGMDRSVDVTGVFDPTETMVATLTDPELTIGSKTIKYTGSLTAGQSIVIDSEKFQAYKGETNVLNSISGEFPVLEIGENTVALTYDTSTIGGVVEIRYRERWL